MSLELRAVAPGNGCHNRAAFKEYMWVQDGWTHSAQATSRLPAMVHVPFRMAPPCQYTLTDLGQHDPRCRECSWRKELTNGT